MRKVEMGRNAIFVYGFPSLWGGANTELHHQVYLWLSLGLEVHLIPPDAGYLNGPLHAEMMSAKVAIHQPNDFSAIERDAPVLGYCSEEFLANIDLIRRYSTNTVWVNCMSNLWGAEKKRMAEGKIRTFLYQNQNICAAHAAVLSDLNRSVSAQFIHFTPYFDSQRFPMIEHRCQEYFGCGRISRAAPEKYAKDILRIYEYFVAPKPKRGLFLGFDERCELKIGKPFPWIRTARNQLHCSQSDFYRHCEIVLQPTDTIENWPRVGFEAMSSGSILIVDDRGGWRGQISHGITGWLCGNERDFMYYASKMAYEPNHRLEMAHRARARVQELAGKDVSQESWFKVFKAIN
jgi:Glycosyl transferases group 1